jgi:hypothetical protein
MQPGLAGIAAASQHSNLKLSIGRRDRRLSSIIQQAEVTPEEKMQKKLAQEFHRHQNLMRALLKEPAGQRTKATLK